ncbi:MAG TPA: LysR substrate-binding domain-containing protein [Lysobacter sp.]|nr:LysR substrate-binding domain-containing protein [Lysobacter sp.]
MTSRTPPLPALRAFAALVRLGSVKAAAEELNLTQGAVGHQIRALESFLDIQLIERKGRRLALTEEGRIYGYQVRQALDDIADATERARRRKRQSREQLLRVSVLPSFAQGWLLPRLGGFFRQYTKVRLHLHGSMEYVDLDDGKVDCAIRFGHGHWSDAAVRPLMNDSLMLVAAPGLLGRRPPKSVEQLLKLPLLHSSENWSAWLTSLPGAPTTLQRPPTRMELSDSTHLLEAARLGLGVALTRRSIADGLLQRGELVLAHPHECEHASSYYALVPPAALGNPTLEAFLGWLQVECATFARRARLAPISRG